MSLRGTECENEVYIRANVNFIKPVFRREGLPFSQREFITLVGSRFLKEEVPKAKIQIFMIIRSKFLFIRISMKRRKI